MTVGTFVVLKYIDHQMAALWILRPPTFCTRKVFDILRQHRPSCTYPPSTWCHHIWANLPLRTSILQVTIDWKGGRQPVKVSSLHWLRNLL